MTQTTPPPLSVEPRVARPPRADRLSIARIVIGIEAALMTYLVLFHFIGTALDERSGSAVLAAVLAVAGAAILVWGFVHMGRDRPVSSPDSVQTAELPASSLVGSRWRVSWDWTDFAMFWPGAFVAAALLIQVAVPIADIFLTGVDATVRNAVESFVQSAMYYSGALLNIYVLVGLRRNGSLAELGWRIFKWWWIPVAVAAAYATLNIADFLQEFSQRLLPNQVNQQCITVRHEFGHFIVLAVIVVCVMAPLAEETIFRGFVYGWLRRWSPVAVAVPISGGVFALLHQELLLLLPLFAVGCALALVYQGSKSLWPGAVVHALFNLPGIIAILNVTSC